MAKEGNCIDCRLSGPTWTVRLSEPLDYEPESSDSVTKGVAMAIAYCLKMAHPHIPRVDLTIADIINEIFTGIDINELQEGVGEIDGRLRALRKLVTAAIELRNAYGNHDCQLTRQLKDMVVEVPNA